MSGYTVFVAWALQQLGGNVWVSRRAYGRIGIGLITFEASLDADGDARLSMAKFQQARKAQLERMIRKAAR